jgi:dipeptidase
MNEHQVSIGESTCSSKLWAPPVGYYGGKALLEASELSQIALERCSTARCAVQMMGDLAVQYGFYSAEYDPADPDNAQGEGGEALTVADPNEAWMFHIIADDTGASAVWVAQRVPDDHITAVANEFVIQDVDPSSPDFLYSSNLWDVAERNGFWSRASGTPLNFVNTYSVSRYHPFYATRRVWRVLSIAAPSLNLPDPDQDWNVDYPFSVKVEKKMAVDDVIAILRDHYDGTKYDTAASLAGGPYGDPNRWDMGDNGEMTFAEQLKGEFPRTISLFRYNLPSLKFVYLFVFHLNF